jgi:hypothetical protein
LTEIKNCLSCEHSKEHNYFGPYCHQYWNALEALANCVKKGFAIWIPKTLPCRFEMFLGGKYSCIKLFISSGDWMDILYHSHDPSIPCCKNGNNCGAFNEGNPDLFNKNYDILHIDPDENKDAEMIDEEIEWNMNHPKEFAWDDHSEDFPSNLDGDD